MAIEIACVFDKQGKALYWHDLSDCSRNYIPDSMELWNIVWNNRKVIGGVAHTHPWFGDAVPSQVDVTTFSAIERGIGKLLWWPIVTMDNVSCYHLNYSLTDPKYIKIHNPIFDGIYWDDVVKELRKKSQLGEEHG